MRIASSTLLATVALLLAGLALLALPAGSEVMVRWMHMPQAQVLAVSVPAAGLGLPASLAFALLSRRSGRPRR